MCNIAFTSPIVKGFYYEVNAGAGNERFFAVLCSDGTVSVATIDVSFMTCTRGDHHFGFKYWDRDSGNVVVTDPNLVLGVERNTMTLFLKHYENV